MQAIILAAGRGSRMKEQTNDRPKCLVELAGRPLLSWQLDCLKEGGVSHIYAVTGYRSESILPYVDKTFHNPDWAMTNMVETLCCADALLKTEPCIVSYSDIVYHPTIIQSLIGADGEIILPYDTAWRSLWEQRFKNPLSDAETFSTHEGYLTAIGEKASSLDEIEGQYMGLLKITPGGWAKVREVIRMLSKQIDMTSMLRYALARFPYLIRTLPITGKWCEVDSQADAALYEEQLQQTTSWLHDWRNICV